MTEQDLLDIEARLEPGYYIVEWVLPDPDEVPADEDTLDPEDRYGPRRYGPFTKAGADAKEAEAKAKGTFASRSTTQKFTSPGTVRRLIAEVRRLREITGERGVKGNGKE